MTKKLQLSRPLKNIILGGCSYLVGIVAGRSLPQWKDIEYGMRLGRPYWIVYVFITILFCIALYVTYKEDKKAEQFSQKVTKGGKR